MPDVRNCRRCGRMYNYIGGAPICPDCKAQDEVDFKLVKEYLYKNPGASMSDVSTALEMTVEKITRYLKEGRLEIIGEGGNIVLQCEKCGKSLKTGRFCDECSRDLTRDLSSTVKDMNQTIASAQEKKKVIEMRYLNKDDKGR